MRRALTLGVGAALALTACGASLRPSGATPDQVASIERVLDEWHAAAASSDEETYFELLADDSVFLGTDATERWGEAAFRAYAHPHFEAGRGWVFRAVRRDVTVDTNGRLAWFDEDLATEGLGPARGSGVMRLEPDGAWRIVQYNLAITVPNPRFAEVRALLEAAAPATAPSGP